MELSTGLFRSEICAHVTDEMQRTAATKIDRGTEEECEKRLAQLIREMKQEIAAMKAHTMAG